MAISYTEAVQLVGEEAKSHVLSTETVSLFDACDRVAADAIHSPISTPEYDTSAMDGFALSSVHTEHATPENPVTFRVTGTTTAGDRPHSAPDLQDGIPHCVEIMTGAPFPLRGTFDCCVPVEEIVTENKGADRYISVVKPAKPFQHRRFAGGDFHKGDPIVARGECIQPQHVMAMASVGLRDIPVVRRLRIALFSTGCELKEKAGPSHSFTIHDANGPYLSTVLRRWGVEVDFRGVVPDNQQAMEHAIETALDDEFDLIVTSGAVSAGRCDIIPSLIKRIGGRTVFHKVAVKPGRPILFAMLPGHQETAFFGLPGNPVAAAACLRFFVLQYVRTSQLQGPEQPQHAHLQNAKQQRFRPEPDIFRPAVFDQARQQVRIIEDHSPGKTKPFMEASCWVHIPRGVSEVEDQVRIYT
ncbi:MoeA, N-terminal and linker domain-containing protein [Aspergillus unguis]